ncbi:MAG: DUF4350 domain-containing protein [Chloroflexota bacterium]
MRRSRPRLGDRGLMVILLLLLGVIVIVERVIARNAEQNIVLSSTSDRANGASALYGWLEQLGFEVDNQPIPEFTIPADVGLIFMLEPSEFVTGEEWNELESWVDQGGILIVSGSGPLVRFVYEELGYGFPGLEIAEIEGDVLLQEHETPFLNLIDLESEQLQVDGSLETVPLMPTADQVIHLSADGKPLVVSHPIGQGHIILAPERSIFTNQGLASEGNQKLVLNLVAQQGPGSKIWFNEWHHGQRELDFSASQITGPIDWLRFTPSGRAVLLSCALLFFYMLFNGRRLGRPQPLPESLVRRGPAEYVDALATLTRQTGDTQIVAQHSYQRLRRTLIKRFRLDPNLTDQALVDTLKRVKSPEMAQAAANIITQLKQKDPSESDLIATQAEIDQFIDEYV